MLATKVEERGQYEMICIEEQEAVYSDFFSEACSIAPPSVSYCSISFRTCQWQAALRQWLHFTAGFESKNSSVIICCVHQSYICSFCSNKMCQVLLTKSTIWLPFFYSCVYICTNRNLNFRQI